MFVGAISLALFLSLPSSPKWLFAKLCTNQRSTTICTKWFVQEKGSLWEVLSMSYVLILSVFLQEFNYANCRAYKNCARNMLSAWIWLGLTHSFCIFATSKLSPKYSNGFEIYWLRREENYKAFNSLHSLTDTTEPWLLQWFVGLGVLKPRRKGKKVKRRTLTVRIQKYSRHK